MDMLLDAVELKAPEAMPLDQVARFHYPAPGFAGSIEINGIATSCLR